MDVILHIGAHRCATTTFQHYVNANTKAFTKQGVCFFGPQQTRDGLLTGIIPVDGGKPAAEQLDRATKRLSIHLDKQEKLGTSQLVISDENVTGAARRNLRMGGLYPDIGERLARFNAAFDGRIDRVVFSIRSQETYWSSVWAFAVGRGHRLPKPKQLERLAHSPRLWRDVIIDLSCALPDSKIMVMPYEIFGGMPERVMQHMTGLSETPMRYAREWLNRSPSVKQLRKAVSDRGGDTSALPEEDGRWQPFSEQHCFAMKEAYADDLFWLRAGADGLATLVDTSERTEAGQNVPDALTARGQEDGIENRRMA